MKIKNVLFRYGLFLIGLFFAALGVAFSTKAGLGTSPVSSVPYSISLLNHKLSFGMWLNLFSVLQILIQIAILRKNCKWLEILIQTILAFVYGYLTNFSCFLVQGMVVETYFAKFACMIASCFILGFGLWLQLKGGVAMLPGEAMNRAISFATGFKYENIKIIIDLLYILISVAICLIFLGGLKGVREGSIIAAVLIGNIIKIYNWLWNKITKKTEVKKSDIIEDEKTDEDL